mgnify:CR=1 FL=1
MDLGGGGGIDPLEIAVERLGPLGGRARGELAANCGIGGGPLEEPVGQRLQIQTGAPDEEWDCAARFDLALELLGAIEIAGDGVGLARIDQIDGMERRLRLLGFCGFRRNDVEAAVDEHRIHRHELDRRARRARASRELDCDRGLTCGGRAHEKPAARRGPLEGDRFAR